MERHWYWRILCYSGVHRQGCSLDKDSEDRLWRFDSRWTICMDSHQSIYYRKGMGRIGRGKVKDLRVWVYTHSLLCLVWYSKQGLPGTSKWGKVLEGVLGVELFSLFIQWKVKLDWTAWERELYNKLHMVTLGIEHWLIASYPCDWYTQRNPWTVKSVLNSWTVKWCGMRSQ